MTDEELERALRAALRPEEPDERFADRLLARLAPAAPAAAAVRYARLRRWVPVAMAACLLASVGLGYQRVQQQRARTARSELLWALNVTSGYVNAVRGMVIREERAAP